MHVPSILGKNHDNKGLNLSIEPKTTYILRSRAYDTRMITWIHEVASLMRSGLLISLIKKI